MRRGCAGPSAPRRYTRLWGPLRNLWQSEVHQITTRMVQGTRFNPCEFWFAGIQSEKLRTAIGTKYSGGFIATLGDAHASFGIAFYNLQRLGSNNDYGQVRCAASKNRLRRASIANGCAKATTRKGRRHFHLGSATKIPLYTKQKSKQGVGSS